MTEPILTAQRRRVTGVVATTRPLANRTVIDRIVDTVVAAQVWSGCTEPQRALLEELCPALAEKLVCEGILKAEDMPPLPERVGRQSVAAMYRRGLCDESGRLTGKAVHTWYYRPKRSEA